MSTTTEAAKMIEARNEKAAEIRSMRKLQEDSGWKFKRAEFRRFIKASLTYKGIGLTPKPSPETLGDYYPFSVKKVDNGRSVAVAGFSGDAEYWKRSWLLEGEWDAEEICWELGISGYHYGGPGRGFINEPHIEFNGHSTLVTQTGGLDI